MTKIFRFLFVPVLLFALMSGASADWCQKLGGGMEPCGGKPNDTWVECHSDWMGGSMGWCLPSNSSSGKKKSNNSMTTTLVAVGVGVVFVGAMWYIFRTPKSDHNPGQVKLVSF
ncbi:MAG: hypothetical protein FWF34_01500 [Alphaproteobacteria bacterium]|nr:hypothetical protein [Alphaproteobacteria bacterium]MCL2889914.1 hypothetical protein [Alphaproteobacteria bacterium]